MIYQKLPKNFIEVRFTVEILFAELRILVYNKKDMGLSF